MNASHSRAPESVSLYFWQVCLLACMAGIICLKSPALGGSALLCIALGDWPRLRHGGRHAIRFLILALACGAGYAAAIASVPERPDMSAFAQILHERARIEGRIVRVDAMPDYRLRVVLDNSRLTSLEGSPALPGLVLLTWQDAPLRPLVGQRLSADIRLRPIGGFRNPGTYDAESYWGEQNTWLRGWMRGTQGNIVLDGEGNLGTRTREAIRSRLLAVLASRDNRPWEKGFPELSAGSAAIPALLLNDRFFMRSADMDILARATLVHSLALSGMHLGLAALLGAFLAVITGRIWPGIYIRVAGRRRLALLFALPFALCYLWLGGAPVSLVRAGLMLFFAACLAWAGRPRALLDGLFLALLCLLIYTPLCLFDLRLQLSAIAIAGIGLSLPLLFALRTWWDGLQARRRRRRHSRLPRIVWSILNLCIINLAVQLIQMPLVANSFGFMGLGGVLNLIWLPILSLVAMPAAALGLLLAQIPGLEHLAWWVLQICAACVAGLGHALAWLDAHGALIAPQLLRPLPAASLGYWCSLAAAALIWQAYAHHRGAKPFIPPRHGLAMLALGACFLFGPVLARQIAVQDDSVTLTLIDVSQGQSVLIEQGDRRLLLDAGGVAPSGFDTGRAIVAPVLTRNRPPRLDYAVYSHPDVDHARGLLYILERFHVEHAAGNNGTPRPSLANGMERIFTKRGLPEIWQAGQIHNIAPGLAIEVLSPPAEQAGSQAGTRSIHNARSLVLRLVKDGRGLAILPGDAEQRVLRELAKSGLDLTAEVLLIPHHGSKSSLSPEFYDAVRPRIALVSCGAGNQWNFPRPEVRAALAERGIPLFSTSEIGQIVIRFGEDGKAELEER